MNDNGLRGEKKNPSAIAGRVTGDLWYVANWSLCLDLKILSFTPVYGLMSTNAFEGIRCHICPPQSLDQELAL